MNDAEIRKIIREEITKNAISAQYDTTRVPVHVHNNIDAPNIPLQSIIGYTPLPITPLGILTLLSGSSTKQAISYPPSNIATSNPGSINTFSIPVIYGSGTTSTDTLTGTPTTGATSATLTGAFGGTTGIYGVKFFSTEVRNVQLTNGSTSISWTPGLSISAGSTTITIIANARFKGGEAAFGTTIFFRNDDDGIYQMWVRSEPGVVLESWVGVNFGNGVDTDLFIYT